MTEQTRFDHESSAIQKHLEIMQGTITRMAENSRTCKVWCVTLVSAILVLVARTGEADHALIALAPTVLFYVLDAYYLSLERGFRRSYGSFVRKIHEGQGIHLRPLCCGTHRFDNEGNPLGHVQVLFSAAFLCGSRRNGAAGVAPDFLAGVDPWLPTYVGTRSSSAFAGAASKHC